MNKCVLGIDLGTSSVKIVRKYHDGRVVKQKNIYQEALPLGWWKAIEDVLFQIDWKEIEAIALTSQVGTYIVNDEHVIGWNSDIGNKELIWWKENYDKEIFIKEISMPHPDIISYPLPRLKYIKNNFEKIEKICQPKEYILERLTGEWGTDAYSWRGLCNLEKKEYSSYFLNEVEIEEKLLPPIKSYNERAGYTKEINKDGKKIPSGIPVYMGLNDYYAGLLGMGIQKPGQMFDITGTSEHLGILQKEVAKDSTLVSGPYLEYMVHYGVTASSGPSIKYGMKLEQLSTIDMNEVIALKPPVFLPYVRGERAPIWNADARGVFFGVEDNCSQKEMSYAVMEGVVFSLYHIYETMGKPDLDKITVSGGAASIEMLNQLKAEVFNTTIEVVKESDVSALGACMIAAVGEGWYEDFETIRKEWVEIVRNYTSGECYHDWFEKRFQLYKEIYEKLKPLFDKWKEL